jgi:hypothetical protein
VRDSLHSAFRTFVSRFLRRRTGFSKTGRLGWCRRIYPHVAPLARLLTASGFAGFCAKRVAAALISVAIRAIVTLTELFPPAYSPLARQTRTSGDVQLDLKIRQDGSVDSLEVFSGHPLLAPAALDSVKQSHFRCANCGENLTAYRLVYTFQFVDTEQCCSTTEADLPEPSQTENHITVFARPTCTCDPAWTIGKVRSIKCLYLWHCSVR